MAKRQDAAHITFRIANPAVVAELSAKAAASGSSPNLIARELVTDGLTRPDEILAALDQLNAKVSHMEANFQRLDIIQRKLERGIYLLLRYGGKLDATQARTAMERYFTSGAPPADLGHVIDQEDGPGK